ncbi:PA3715 family protein [Nonlabens ponticola]|uniref:Uncharacterized protein n=1 Tax=Nonlabens ponticola TaxID=2496866 RepID=A0A3S9MYM3_9FLAO|nr:hypothetical protein [Nonlabens ponticola]AZQ44351.1 hypothetical protein EJ995_08910 [Nonlabens ponticola]
MRKMLCLAALLVATLSSAQEAIEDELVKAAIQFLDIDENDLLRDKVAFDEYSSDRIIAVLPVISGRYEDCDYCYDIDNHTVIWNSQTKEFYTHYVKQNAWTSDALYLSSIEIDLSFQNINNYKTAFGLTYNYGGSSRIDPYHAVYLNLYYVENKKIVEILNSFKIEESHGHTDGSCENVSFEKSKIIFFTQLHTGNRFKPISLNSITTNYRYDENCDKEIIDRTSSFSEFLTYSEADKKYIVVKEQ